MGLIPKIVLTPVKWASKRIIHHTLLRFPGGDPQSQIACVYCPEMCRFACPTAVASGSDAVTPSNKMSLLYKEAHWPGQASQGAELWPIYDCTGCGRCTEYCVYEMPVAERLFHARAEKGWDWARSVAAEINDADDPVGDLAEELGDGASAERRLQGFLARAVSAGAENAQVPEPRMVAFLRRHGKSGELTWSGILRGGEGFLNLVEKLQGRTWLVHESPWLNRHLSQSEEVKAFGARLAQAGVQMVFPFASGNDCIDCGGEGAYHRLFSGQARQMALDFWERDRHRAAGILCFSSRCADHFRGVLGADFPVVDLPSFARSGLTQPNLD